MADAKEEELGKGIIEGLIDALTDKHTRMEIELRGLSVKLPGLSSPIELSGTVSISVRMSDPSPAKT